MEWIMDYIMSQRGPAAFAYVYVHVVHAWASAGGLRYVQ